MRVEQTAAMSPNSLLCKSAPVNKATLAFIVIQAIIAVLYSILSLLERLGAKTLTEDASILCQFRDTLEVLFHDNLQTTF